MEASAVDQKKNGGKERLQRMRSLIFKTDYILVISILIILVAGILFGNLSVRWYMNYNTKSLAAESLSDTAAIQSLIIRDRVDNEFKTLETIESYVELGLDFSEPEGSEMLKLIVEANVICMLATADTEGNVTSWEGKQIGNISDRSYFSDVIDGTEARKCEYLASPRGADEPRVILSIPVIIDGEIRGVLFESKEIDVLSRSLLSDLDKDSALGFAVIDQAGNVFAVGGSIETDEDGTVPEKLLPIDAEGHFYLKNGRKSSEDTLSDALMETGVTESAVTYKLGEDDVYAACIPLNVNGWYLCCVMSKADAEAASWAESRAERLLINAIMISWLLVIGCCICLTMLRSRMIRKNTRWAERQYEIYRQMLEHMKCSVVEYDIDRDRVVGNHHFAEMFSGYRLNGRRSSMDVFHKWHPEFGMEEFNEVLDYTISNASEASFETVLKDDKNGMKWLNIVMMPVTDTSGRVHGVFMTLQDVTSHHMEYERAAERLKRIPGGLYSCRLVPELSYDYVSESLYRMLGRDPGEALRKKDIIHLIHEEDLEEYRSFLKRSALRPGTHTCEYRMLCADGSTMFVLDTLDIEQDSTGDCFAHSVITDMSRIMSDRVSMEAELAETKDRLVRARVRISTGQMQPHFLYNALASIREIVLDDPEYASELIYDFTIHLRACIKSMATDEPVPFSQELANIRAYAAIEKMRFGDRLRIEYDIQTEDFLIIPLGIQPIVENAIRHGIHDRGEQGGTVKIATERKPNAWVITVEDDGVGFDPEEIRRQVESGERDSTGIQNLTYRFKALMNADTEIKSVPGKGTRVTVSIPYEA